MIREKAKSASPRKGERGITLVEAIVSLVIVASAIIPAMTALGGATDNVLKTSNRRVMRYLAQMVIADIELGKLHPEEEMERYEEGASQTFEGFGSDYDPDEYANYEYTVEILREVPIVGGNEEQLEDQGFEATESGQFLGRPVSNDLFAGDEEDVPEGQMKRVVVVAIRMIAEDAADDRTLRVMTYLPMPNEEEAAAALGENAGGAAGAGAGAGGAGEPLKTATSSSSSERRSDK